MRGSDSFSVCLLSKFKHCRSPYRGAEDIATLPELGRELAGLITGAQFSLVEDAAHLPCIEQPQAVARRMTRFFQEVQIV